MQCNRFIASERNRNGTGIPCDQGILPCPLLDGAGGRGPTRLPDGEPGLEGRPVQRNGRAMFAGVGAGAAIGVGTRQCYSERGPFSDLDNWHCKAHHGMREMFSRPSLIHDARGKADGVHWKIEETLTNWFVVPPSDGKPAKAGATNETKP